MTSATLRRPKSKRTIRSLVPVVGWLTQYDVGDIRPDVVAAITVWALLAPEAMAYAGVDAFRAKADSPRLATEDESSVDNEPAQQPIADADAAQDD